MSILGGLDIHRAQITFSYADTATGEVKNGRIENPHRAEFARWLSDLGTSDVELGMEGCTGWWYVAEEISRAGMRARVGDPAELAALKPRKKRAKTDRADARHMRVMLADDRFPDSWVPPAHVAQTRTLGRLYLDLRNDRAAWSQRVHATLFHHGFPSLKGALDSGDGRALALKYADEMDMINRHAVITAIGTIGHLTTEMETLKQQLGWVSRNQPGANALMDLYGIGERTAAIVWAELGDVRRFSSSKKAVRHSGLDISIHDSDGNRSAGKITRQGPPALRWALYEAGFCAARPSSPDYQYYRQVRSRVHHTAAVLSVGRKIAKRSYHILKDLGDNAMAEPQSKRPRPQLSPRSGA